MHNKYEQEVEEKERELQTLVDKVEQMEEVRLTYYSIESIHCFKILQELSSSELKQEACKLPTVTVRSTFQHLIV